MKSKKKYNGIFSLLSLWAKGRDGAILIYMAFLIPVLTATIGLGIDMTQSYMMRERLTRAMDAAALAAAGSGGLSEAEMQARVDKFMAANYPPAKIGAYYNVKLKKDGDHVTVTGSADFNTAFMRFISNDLDVLTVNARTAVNRKLGANIELALVLDISGSMDNPSGTGSVTKIQDLRAAAKSLVDTVVYADQSEFTSKIAIVPYAVAVNAGTYATAARGAITTIPTVTITAVTRANPAVVTAAGHGFSNGDIVYITGQDTGMTQINNKLFTVANKATNTFQLSGTNSSSYSTYKTGGKVLKPCTAQGCDYYRFTNTSSQNMVFTSSTCVSERTGFYAYTDDPPTTAKVGYNYPAPTNTCLSSKITPLTNNKTTLKADIDALVAGGSTGGQVGIAWGWYMLSPNFGYMFPLDSAPKPYKSDKLHKVAVIMTDGELNSPYCNGVIAKDATSGSGNATDHINCNAPNGDTYSQGRKLCDEMKKAGIEIYTIGFKVKDYPNGKALMQYCAKDEAHFFDSQDGDDLKRAFQSIATNVNQLYIYQ